MNEKHSDPAILERNTMVTILNMMADHFNEEEQNRIREEYAVTEGYEEITGNKHSMITGAALNIVKNIIQKSGSENEVHRALEYLMVCKDAKKYHLDYRRCYKELLIPHLLEKYGLKRKKD